MLNLSQEKYWQNECIKNQDNINYQVMSFKHIRQRDIWILFSVHLFFIHENLLFS